MIIRLEWRCRLYCMLQKPRSSSPLYEKLCTAQFLIHIPGSVAQLGKPSLTFDTCREECLSSVSTGVLIHWRQGGY